MRSFALLPLLCTIAAAVVVEGPPDGAIVPIKEAVVAPPPNDAIVDTAAVYTTATTMPQGYGSAVESYPSTSIATTSAYTEVIPSKAEKETETSVPATVYMTVSVSVSVAYTTTLTTSAEPTYSASDIPEPTWHSAGPSSYHNSTAYSNTTSALSHSRSYTKSVTKSNSAKPTTFSTRTHTYSSNSYQNATVTLYTPTYSAPTESAPTATETFYPGGLTDPTLDEPCYNASCANPSSDMNFKVTITPGEVGASSGAQAVRVGAMSALVGVVALMFLGGL